MGPPLSKKSFPVGRVGKKTASREVGNFFLFLISIFFKTRMYRGKSKKKKNSSRPFLAHPAGGQVTIFYLRTAWPNGLIVDIQ